MDGNSDDGRSRSRLKTDQLLVTVNVSPTESNGHSMQNSNPDNNNPVRSINKIVIIIKPISENCKEFINNPFEIVNAIEKSKFGKLNVNNITTNKWKGLIIATVENSAPAIISELLAVKKLGEWYVDCYIPNRDRFKTGVTWPIGDQQTYRN